MKSLLINPDVIKLVPGPLAESMLKPVPAKITRKGPDKFTAALVHEIRNPLANINLAVEILKSPLSDDAHKIYLDILTRSVSKINAAVTDLLNYLQADETQFKNHSVHQLLDEAVAMAEDRIVLKKITLIKAYSDLNSKVFINKQVMKIALTNIIINAIEAMPSDKGKLKLVARSIKGIPVIEIEDNGIGIAEENLKNIFDPYFTKKPGGMGLGLSTSLKILLSNHAKIAVKSEPDRGTRFIITFNNVQACKNHIG
jgi:signal transduction histidine kinase